MSSMPQQGRACEENSSGPQDESKWITSPTKESWTKVPWEEAKRRMGKNPISVGWVDVSKGDDLETNYRSRLVARDIKRKGESCHSFPSLTVSPQVYFHIFFIFAFSSWDAVKELLGLFVSSLIS